MAEKTRACESCGETNGHRIDCPTLPDCGCRDDHVSWCPHFNPRPSTEGKSARVENPLSGEDRARLENLAPDALADALALQAALALIDQQEKALEAADELARVVEESPVGYGLPRSARAYRSARATETRADATSTKEGRDEQ